MLGNSVLTSPYLANLMFVIDCVNVSRGRFNSGWRILEKEEEEEKSTYETPEEMNVTKLVTESACSTQAQ